MTARVTLTRTVIFIYTSIFSQKPSFFKSNSVLWKQAPLIKPNSTSYAVTTLFGKSTNPVPVESGLIFFTRFQETKLQISSYILSSQNQKVALHFSVILGPLGSKLGSTLAGPVLKAWCSPVLQEDDSIHVSAVPASDLSLIAPALLSSSVSYRDSSSSGCQEGLQEDLCTVSFARISLNHLLA